MNDHENRLRATVAEIESKRGSNIDPEAMAAACRFLATLTPRAQASAWFGVNENWVLQFDWAAGPDWSVTIGVGRYSVEISCALGEDTITGTAVIDGAANPVVAGAIEMVLARGAAESPRDDNGNELVPLELRLEGWPFTRL